MSEEAPNHQQPLGASAPDPLPADSAVQAAPAAGVSQDDLDTLAAALGAEDAAGDLDALLSGASFEDPVPADDRSGARRMPSAGSAPSTSRSAPALSAGIAAAAVDMPHFDKVLQEAQVSGIDLLRDVNLEVKIELGRSRMLVEDVLKLVEGSVVELDKLAGDPVDVFVNERLVARGEVLVLNDNFCVRVNEIIQTSREEEL